MTAVRVTALRKSFRGRRGRVAIVLDDLDVSLDEGTFLVLLGASGCGKTTLLRCLAGLEDPDSGRIDLGAKTAFDAHSGIKTPPDRRNVGMVFQSYALWPHMTVRSNIEYPLRVRKLRSAISEGWTGTIAETLRCSSLLDRYPSQLSGGQQQRVALARGLVARPDLLLLDEPLSNLDARLRDDVRSELHELHTRLGFTAVHVTHDQREALALADRLALMNAGRIEQIDRPAEVFEAPATEHVAYFVGLENRLTVSRRSHAWCLGSGEELTGFDYPHTPDGGLVIRIRPEDIRIGTEPEVRSDEVMIHGTIVDTSYAGREREVVLAADGNRIKVRGPIAELSPSVLALGSRISASFHLRDVRVFDANGRALPSHEHVRR